MPTIDTVLARIESTEKDRLGRLIDWLRMPSISTDPAFSAETRKAGQWAVDQLRAVGLDAKLVEVTAPASKGMPERPGHPVVWAHHPGPDGYNGPHMLFYGHYDVQPADPLELWESPPFEPVVKPAVGGKDAPGERVVARGAVDDKGQVHCFLEALRAWKDAAGEIPIKLTVLIEGEEESGSVSLPGFMRRFDAELRACDVCVISDTGMLNRRTPAITYGVRGLLYTEVILRGPDQDLHSGLWGGRVPNPANELPKVLAQLWDDNRRVTIPGFYDTVRELAPSEREGWAKLPKSQIEALRSIGLPPEADVGEAGFTATEREWARPTAEINGLYGGYTGKGAKTVIPSFAGAKISFRLVADQDPAAIEVNFRKWLDERTPLGCRWEFIEHSGGPPATVSTDSRELAAAARALEKASGGTRPALIKSGGSIPVVGLLKSMCSLDTLLVGFGLDDDRVHSPNEKFELDCWRLGTRAHAWLIDEFSRLG